MLSQAWLHPEKLCSGRDIKRYNKLEGHLQYRNIEKLCTLFCFSKFAAYGKQINTFSERPPNKVWKLSKQTMHCAESLKKAEN